MQIIVTEIPYAVNKARLIAKIAELIKEKKIEGISDIRDESSREGMRIVIELKRDANPQVTLNQLYKHTQLQDNFSCIMLALVNGEPKVLNLYQILDEYIKFQKEVVTRRTRFDLAKAEARAHILEGLRIALDNIDEIIHIIRNSYNDARQRLMDRFGLSEIQAQAILDMRLARLQGLEREKIENEYKELMERIAYYKTILADESVLMNVIKTELLEIKEKWSDPRRTKLAADADELEDEDLIEEEQVAITLTHLGYIKRVPADTYKAQRRGGKGITGITTRDNDFVKDLIITSTHDQMMFFTNTGKAHRLRAFEIPEASRTARGTPAVNFLNLLQGERITALIPVRNFEEDKYLVMVTRDGTIKKTPIAEYNTSRSTGIIAIKLKEEDQLIDVLQTNGHDHLLIVTKRGKCICFSEEDVRPMGRIAGGVRAITLDEDDEVVSMCLVEDDRKLLVVTENGFGKRTDLSEYKVQARGGKGLLTYDKTRFDKTGLLIGALTVKEDDEILLINSDGIIIRIRADEVSELGRSTQGVRIMKVEDDSKIVSMARVINEEDEEDNEEEEAPSESE